MGESLVEIKDLTKTFYTNKNFITRKSKEVHAVNHVCLSIERGKTLGLVGESGCGKSTLSRCILRLIEPSSGQVLFKGLDILKLPQKEMRLLRQKMQIIFQDPYASLNPRMTILESVRAPLDVFGIGTPSERVHRAKEILHTVGINDEQLHRFPHEFSGGQRQRIDIARALILRPEFIICDEPVSALDASVRASVLNLMNMLQQQMGLTYLFISHDLSVIKHISDRIAVMYLGSIVEIADKDELYNNPLHPYTQALLAAIPIPDPTRRSTNLPIQGEMPSPYNIPSGCPFHTRCPFCRERCREEIPLPRKIQGSHFVSCHFVKSSPTTLPNV